MKSANKCNTDLSNKSLKISATGIWMLSYGLYVALKIFTIHTHLFNVLNSDLCKILYNLLPMTGAICSFCMSRPIVTYKWFWGTLCLCIGLLIVTFNSHNYSLAVIVVFIVTGLRISNEQILQTYLRTSFLVVVVTLTLCLIGIFPDVVTTSGIHENRHTLGFDYAMTYASLLMYMSISYFIYKQRNITYCELIIFLISYCVVMYFADTRAAFAEGCIFIFLLWLLRTKSNIFCGSFFKYIVAIIMPVFAVTSITLCYLYDPTDINWLMADGVLSGRLHLQADAMEMYGLSFLGQESNLVFGEDVIRVDSAYTFIVITYGILPLLLLVVAFSAYGIRCYKNGDYTSCIAFILISVHSFSDPPLIDPSHNPFILLVGITLLASYNNKLQKKSL